MSTAIRYRIASGRPQLAHVAQDGAPKAMTPTSPQVSRLARQLALAYAIDGQIEDGSLKDLATAAKRLGLTRARVTQIMNLRWLPVTVQESLLNGTVTTAERNLRGTAIGLV